MLPYKVHGIIPARYASTRFPGKPLADIHGKPMFWHVWHRAGLCPALASVTLATDDKRIALAAKALGVPFVMTDSTLPSGTDRVHQAAGLLGLPDDAVIINIQGDEPALDPSVLADLAAAFKDRSVEAATLAHRISASEAASPDRVKLVMALNGDALYFSRAPIPYPRDGEEGASYLGHIGLYAFRRSALARFTALPPSALEQREKLEQLRLLENGIPIRVILTDKHSIGVDSPQDLEQILKILSI